MSRPINVLGLLSVLLLAGCGGSSATSSTTTAVTRSTTTSAATSPAPTTPAPTTTASTSTRTATTPQPAPGSAKTSPPAPKGARIPATFKIGAGGTLSPPTISAPSGFNVAVTLANGDSKAHTVIIKTPTPSAAIHLPVGGHSYLLETKLAKGTYPITVDGATRGALVIGSAPGP